MDIYLPGDGRRKSAGPGKRLRIVPCKKCRAFDWQDKATAAVGIKAVETVEALTSLWSAGPPPDYQRHKLLPGEVDSWLFSIEGPRKSLRLPSSYQFAVLRGALIIASIVDVADIESRSLSEVYKMTDKYIAHVCNEHVRQEKRDMVRGSFKPAYLDWIQAERLFYLFPVVRGKSVDEIRLCAERCISRNAPNDRRAKSAR